MNLSQEILKSVLSYDACTGKFTWLKNSPSRKIGDIAGRLNSSGYVQITISRKTFCAHRLAWLYVYGRWPKENLDHINGDQSDDRIENLRECTFSENQQNRSRKVGVTGFRGVIRSKKKFRAKIGLGGRTINLGCFENAEEAYEAYLEAKKELHPFQPVPRETVPTKKSQ